ncbi:ADP,ATP carrier protein 3, mitochondrial-like [Bidens hawaiensis]|uniref:ADP,ATP carrier protein 3, mitochondrial-like n=1 Tax=Bidens hawaiensis TaxID=980011 RepID=UPI004049E71E
MGRVSGAVSKTVVAPLDCFVFKVSNQYEIIKVSRLSHPYMGVSDFFSRTVKYEGLLSLWRGNTGNVIPYFSKQAWFEFTRRHSPLMLNFLESFLVAWWCTTNAKIVSYPIEAIRRKMLMTSGQAVYKYKNSMDAFVHILKKGVLGLCSRVNVL